MYRSLSAVFNVYLDNWIVFTHAQIDAAVKVSRGSKVAHVVRIVVIHEAICRVGKMRMVST